MGADSPQVDARRSDSPARSLAAALLIVAALALAACGDDDETTGTVQATTGEAAETQTDAATRPGAGSGQTSESDSSQPGEEEGSSESSEAGSASVAIERLDRERSSFVGTPVLLRGRATSLGQAGFLLRDSSGAIVVLAPNLSAADVQGGRIEVRGRVRRFSQFQVGELRESAASVGQMPLYGRAPLGAGDPYVELSAFARIGGS